MALGRHGSVFLLLRQSPFAEHRVTLHLFARAAITEYHRLDGLNKRNAFSHNSGDWRSKNKVSSGLLASEIFVLHLQMAAFSMCPLMVLINA